MIIAFPTIKVSYHQPNNTEAWQRLASSDPVDKNSISYLYNKPDIKPRKAIARTCNEQGAIHKRWRAIISKSFQWIKHMSVIVWVKYICANPKGSFEIMHKIFYSYIEISYYYALLKFYELLDLRTPMGFWNAPGLLKQLCGTRRPSSTLKISLPHRGSSEVTFSCYPLADTVYSKMSRKVFHFGAKHHERININLPCELPYCCSLLR